MGAYGTYMPKCDITFRNLYTVVGSVSFAETALFAARLLYSMNASLAQAEHLACPRADLRVVSGTSSIASSTRVLDGGADLSHLLQAWDDLSAHAVSPNPFYESWMLRPALRFLQGEDAVQLLTVWSTVGGREVLIGLLPIVHRSTYRGLPLHHTATWQHLHCFLSTPLVRVGFERACFDAVFSWFDGSERAGLFLELRQFAGDGPFWEQLEPFLVESGRVIDETDYHQRAVLASTVSSEEYLRNALSGKRRKELTRQMNRLQEQGAVSVVSCGLADDVEPWIKSFVALGRSGWKGREASALGSNVAQEQFFTAIIGEAHQRGALYMSKLLLGARALAMQCTFRSAKHGFAFKIAFDEEFSRFSPGTHLELDKIAYALDRDSGMALYDSCAVPDHFMINRLWTERRAIRRLNISRRSVLGRLSVRTVASLRAVYDRYKQFKHQRRNHASPEAES